MSSEAPGAPYAFPPDHNRYNAAGMVTNAWAKGYKLGVIASSDHSSTHISYAMVYADDASRQGILDAIRQRHTYGAPTILFSTSAWVRTLWATSLR